MLSAIAQCINYCCTQKSMEADYELHVAVNWYLYCIGCDLLTGIQRCSANRRLTMLSELFFRTSRCPVLRITYCRTCAAPFATTMSMAAWADILINRTLLVESKLWCRLLLEHSGSTPKSAMGSYFVIENPKSISLSAEFTYQITDYGRDYDTLESRYPALSKRQLGRFDALAAIDECEALGPGRG